MSYRLDPQRGRWIESAIERPSRATPLDRFGASLALDGSTLLVGATQHDGAGINAGAAWIIQLDDEAER